MKRHVWITPRAGTAGGGKGRQHCLSCGLIRWTVAAAQAISLNGGRPGVERSMAEFLERVLAEYGPKP